MSYHYTVARPYAKAVFAEALKDARLEQWSLVLRGLSLIATHPMIKSLSDNPKVTNDELRALIYDTLKESANSAVSEISDKLQNFLSLLLAEKRLLITKDIDELYHRLLADHQKVVEIEVVSAVSLDQTQQALFYQALEKRFASKVSITFLEDESLIGGALVRNGNWVLDGSVSTKITRLSEALRS